MRSDLVFGAIANVPNRYLLAKLASRAVRGIHKPGVRIEDTTTDLLALVGRTNPIACGQTLREPVVIPLRSKMTLPVTPHRSKFVELPPFDRGFESLIGGGMRSRCLSVDPNMAFIGLVPSEESLLKEPPCWKPAVCESGQQIATFEGLELPLLPSLYNVAFWLFRNAADAEDLVQEAFLKALRGFSRFERGSNFKVWIFRILRNTCQTSRTGLAAARMIPFEAESDCRDESGAALRREGDIDRENPEMYLMRLNDRAALHEARENLATPLLEVILLCDVDEMKYREIAIVLEIPIGTVMSRIARARTALRATLFSNITPRREFRA